MDDKQIGIQIKKARAEAQLTQSELGKKIGVTWEMVSRYENGKSSPRKNLEIIARTLGKPIQYFFGVEDMPITDEIKRLSKLLSERGKELEPETEVPFVESLKGLSLVQALMATESTYNCPKWISINYSDVFALKLGFVRSTEVSIVSSDVGFFVKGVKPKVGNLVLVKGRNGLTVEKCAKNYKRNPLALLVAVEKRYV